MDSKWGYQLTQKADADLDDIVGYIAVELQTQRQHRILLTNCRKLPRKPGLSWRAAL